MQPTQQPLDPPNYTMFPNRLLDKELGELDPPEWCVLCYIVRHTFGWHKSMDCISYNQFLRGTYTHDGRQVDKGCGLSNSTALRRALATLEERGLIVCERRKGEDGRLLSSAYRLVVAADEEQLTQAAGAQTPTTPGVVAYYAPRSTLLRPALYPTTPGVEQQNITTTKETTRKETGEVPPVDIATKVDGSARPARAGGAPDPPLSPPEEGTLDPLEPWLQEMVTTIHKRWGGAATREDLAEWCAVLWENLRDCTADQRDRFPAYLFSNTVLSGLSSPRGVKRILSEDAARWRRDGYPRSKQRKTERPVPAHIQREHDQAYKPPTYSPESIARHLATIRKYKDEECAQRWLAENGLTETGT